MASSKASMKIRTKRATGRRPVRIAPRKHFSGGPVEGGGFDATNNEPAC